MSAWKPGDVAVRRSIGGEEQISIVVAECYVKQHDSGPHFHHADSGWDSLKSPGAAAHGASYRPLVVIDPEDAEQAERLLRLWVNTDPDDAAWAALVDDLTTALREYANPTPRIEEPMGLGAVVEDADGRLFVRHCACTRGRDWRVEGVFTGVPSVAFGEINAVRVLSRGVTPEEAS